MWHYHGEGDNTGAWKCERCGKDYPFRWWKIRRQGAGRKKEKEEWADKSKG
jgi:hypothetical protein